MLGIIMHWENAVWVYESKSAQKKMFNFYKHTLQSFGGKKLILIDVDKKNPRCGDPTIDYEIFGSLEEALDAYSSNFEFVFLEKPPRIPEEFDRTNLKDFVHPKNNTFYVVGSDFSPLNLTLLGNKNYLENNPVVSIDSTGATLWCHVMLGIALYDRLCKKDA